MSVQSHQGRVRIISVICLVWSLIVLSSATPTKKNEKCGIYLAPSTIPGAGMGMFAGHRSFETGEIVADGDLLIPVFELDWHNGDQPYHFLWGEYSWSAAMFDGMDQEVESVDDVHLCSGGFGAAINCRMNLINVEDSATGHVVSLSGVSSESPGAGAFTPHHGRKFEAMTHIPPGMELYADYGETYFETRPTYASVPLRQDFKRADSWLKRFRSLRNKAPALSGKKNVSDALHQDLYNLIVHDFPVKSRASYVLPSNVSQIDHVLATGGTANSTYNESIRDLDWLEEHGQCMDNIKDGISQIPHAGRGAFANRFIPEGGLVAPLPLIHIGDRNILTMYESLVDKPGKRRRNVNAPYHKQLILNYCFGHRDMSLLLCPYGLLTALINHSHKKPNARIVWSENLRHSEWLNESYHNWHKTKHTGLSFDVVALRDIEEDEEILIDYGEEWERAWQQHVANFDAPRRGYMPAFEMNQQANLQIKTINESNNEWIEGIYTYCRKTLVDMALGTENALIHDEDFDSEIFDPEDEECYPCRVMHRNHNDSYVAELLARSDKHHLSVIWDTPKDSVKYVVFDVPRDTFYFRDAFYTRDHHQYWSFRHDMRIPDDMLPPSWRDPIEAQSPPHVNDTKQGSIEDHANKAKHRPGQGKDDDVNIIGVHAANSYHVVETPQARGAESTANEGNMWGPTSFSREL